MRIELLRPQEFASWDALVTQSPHGTVFHYSWWLEATGCNFDILVCRDEREDLIAGIPLPRKKRAGLNLFHSPRLTPYLGPIFDIPKAASKSEQLSLMRHWGESLARAISGYDSLSYYAGAAAPDLQGFLWAGFRVELAYTFRFDAGLSEDQVLEGMVRQHRQNLAKAQRSHMTIEAGDDIDALMELNKQTFSRKGLSLPYEESLPRRMWAAARSRGHASIYLSRNADGAVVAALLVVHDVRAAFQILAGASSEMRRSPGGGYLVTWEAIRDAILAGRAFDFEGSALRGVERNYRYWGAPARPIWRLERAGTLRGALARILFHMRDRKAQ